MLAGLEELSVVLIENMDALPAQNTTDGWLKQQKCTSHTSRGWKSKIQVPAGLESLTPLFLACKCLSLPPAYGNTPGLSVS